MLVAAPSLAAQESNGLSAPTAVERESARAALGDKLPEVYRSALRDGAPPAQLVDALIELGRAREPADIALIARHVSSLNPQVSTAAVDALKGYGRAGLRAVQALDATQIDARTRSQATELLLLEHIRNCCRRDMSINPFRLEFSGRLDELNSVGLPLDDLLLKLLRDALPDIRQDAAGIRYQYYTGAREQPFIQYGGLAVAALAQSRPDALEREFAEVARVALDENPNRYGYYQRTPVTLELADFFARRGSTAMAERMISDMQMGIRGQDARYTAPMHMQIAAMQSAALNEHAAALDRLTGSIQTLGLEPNPALAHAHYLRARILMRLNEHGAALSALEESMEASPSPVVLALVDDAFVPLAQERRMRDVLRYCELRQRVLPPSMRPWRPGDAEAEADPEPEIEPEPEE